MIRTFLVSSTFALALTLAGCGGDEPSANPAAEAEVVKAKTDLVFAGPKADQGKDASKPEGSVKGKKEGDTISLSYAPQRIRGCDAGGWAQFTEVFFKDKSGKRLDEGSQTGEGFGGVGMVPKGQRPLTMKVKVPAKAASVVILTTNDGGPHDAEDEADTKHKGDNKKDGLCFDTKDGKGWELDL